MTFIHYKSWLLVQMLWSSCMWETLKKTLSLVLPHTSCKKQHLQLNETEAELLGTVLEKKNEQKCEKKELMNSNAYDLNNYVLTYFLGLYWGLWSCLCWWVAVFSSKQFQHAVLHQKLLQYILYEHVL